MQVQSSLTVTSSHSNHLVSSFISRTNVKHFSPPWSIYFYKIVSWIDEKIQAGGRVLVHCREGVSRSCTGAMVYLIWRDSKNWKQVFAEVQAKREIVNPNVGFITQMSLFCNHIGVGAARDKEQDVRLYQCGPHCERDPNLVLWPMRQSQRPWQLDPRFCYLLQKEELMYIWTGEQVSEEMKSASIQAIFQHITWAEKFEKRLMCTPCHIKQLHQGQGIEPETFWKLLGYLKKDKDKAVVSQQKYDARFDLFGKLGEESRGAGLLPDQENPISQLPGFGGLSGGMMGGDDIQLQVPKRQRGPPEPEAKVPVKKQTDQPELYQMPDIETPLSMFDSDDLVEDSVFILHSPPSVSLEHSGRKVHHLCVWVGSDVRGVTEADMHKFASDFEATHRLEGQIVVSVIDSGEEDDSFWELFPDG